MKIEVKLLGETEGLDSNSLRVFVRQAFVDLAGTEDAAVEIVKLYMRLVSDVNSSKMLKNYFNLNWRSMRIAAKKYFDIFIAHKIIEKKGVADFKKNKKNYQFCFVDRVCKSIFADFILRQDTTARLKKISETNFLKRNKLEPSL
jgi:hypothetical protein